VVNLNTPHPSRAVVADPSVYGGFGLLLLIVKPPNLILHPGEEENLAWIHRGINILIVVVQQKGVICCDSL
jgi:hypothetical protein